MKSNAFTIGLIVVVAAALFAVVYPTAFDARATIYDYTRWTADSIGAVFGYFALIIGAGLLSRSGGQMRRGLFWFCVGMLIMGSAFFFGPIVNHYKILAPNTVEALHGLGMLGGMLAYLIANYWFLNIVQPNAFSKKFLWIYGVVFVVAVLAFYPTMFVPRALGPEIKYFAELLSFGVSAVMVTMTLHVLGRVGAGYRRTITLLFISTVLMAACYPFGSIGQPNHLWALSEGNTAHHGLMALSILGFMATVFSLRRLEIFSSPSVSMPAMPQATGTLN